MSKERDEAEAKVRVLAQERGLYSLEAYIFVFQALEHTFSCLGKRRHVTGAQLSEGFRQLAVRQYGGLAQMVLGGWGIRSTDDIGSIVFHLVEASLMGKTSRDTLADFHALYDFASAFSDEKPRPPLAQRPPRRRPRKT